MNSLREQGIKEACAVARAEALQEGRKAELLDSLELVLETKFGSPGRELLTSIRQLSDMQKLKIIQRAALTGQSIDDLRSLAQS